MQFMMLMRYGNEECREPRGVTVEREKLEIVPRVWLFRVVEVAAFVESSFLFRCKKRLNFLCHELGGN